MPSRKKPRWSWSRWLARLDATDLNDAQKDDCRALMGASRDRGKARRWVANWEVDCWGLEVPSRRNAGLALALAEKHGLVHRRRGTGFYIATDEPAPPSPGSIRLSSTARHIAGAMLGEWDLYRNNTPGYLYGDKKVLWVLHAHWTTSIPLPTRAVESLGRAGLLDCDGVGHGWPYQHTNRFRLPGYRVCLIRGLSRFVTEGPWHLSEVDRAAAAELLLRGAPERWPWCLSALHHVF